MASLLLMKDKRFELDPIASFILQSEAAAASPATAAPAPATKGTGITSLASMSLSPNINCKALLSSSSPSLTSVEAHGMDPSQQHWQAVGTNSASAFLPEKKIDAGEAAITAAVVSPSSSEDMENQPYAKLIYRALKSVPSRQMVLKDIYKWFQNHTQKPQKCLNGKQGWKNSIRHNLSMNEAFQKIEQTGARDERKKVYAWRLSNTAEKAGMVMSTTRYRNKTSKRRPHEDIARPRNSTANRISKRPTIINKKESGDLSAAIAGGATGAGLTYTGAAGSVVDDVLRSRNGASLHGADAREHKASVVYGLYQRAANSACFDGSFNYLPFDGTHTPSASTMSTVADSNLPDSPITSAPYSPDLIFDRFEIPDFEQTMENPYVVPILDDLGLYRAWQRDVGGSRMDNIQTEGRFAECDLMRTTPTSSVRQRSAMEPATCTLAELKLPGPSEDHFGLIGKYEAAPSGGSGSGGDGGGGSGGAAAAAAAAAAYSSFL